MGLAQAEQGIDCQQFFDQRGAGPAHCPRLGLAPVRVAHEEPNAALRQVGPVRAPALGLGGVGLHQLAVGEELHRGGTGPGVEALADQPIRQGVQRCPDLGVGVRAHFGTAPSGKLEGHHRQGLEGASLFGLEHLEGSAPLEGSRRPPPCHLYAPPARLGHHLGERGEVPPGEKAPSYIALDGFDAGFVFGFPHPRGVYQHLVMSGEFRISPVYLRVVEVGLGHPGAQVVGHQPARARPEELERRHMGVHPSLLVHHGDRVHEQVPRVHEHHREGPDPSALPAGATQVPR